MDLRLDANLASQTMDTITASGFTQNGHNINISNIPLENIISSIYKDGDTK